jgi:hypothetical protein
MESKEIKEQLDSLVASGTLFFVMLTKHGCHPCHVVEPEVREYCRLIGVDFLSFDMASEIGAELSETFKLKSAPSIIGFVNSKYAKATGGKAISELIEAFTE